MPIISKRHLDIYAPLSSGVCGMNYDGNDYYFRKNILGDILAVYDVGGNLLCKYVYDAWGNQKLFDKNGNEISDDGSTIGSINPFRYRGYYWDRDFGLYYLQSRYYDPELGRFISPDDISYLDPESIFGLNLYAYCNNNPVMNVDPYGRFFGWILQGTFSFLMYIGFAIASIFDESIRNDMDSIEWNPFNSCEVAVITSNKVSFYKGVPIFRTKRDDKRSGTFLGIFLDKSVEDIDVIRHEWGHTIQQIILGPIAFGITVGIPSPLKLGDWGDYYNAPWETMADVFGGAHTQQHDKKTVNRAWLYLITSMLVPPAVFLFLI